MKKNTSNRKYTLPEEKLTESKNEMNEPSTVYQTSSTTAFDQDLPIHVLEDIRIGLEQYKRGECRSVSEYMAKYK